MKNVTVPELRMWIKEAIYPTINNYRASKRQNLNDLDGEVTEDEIDIFLQSNPYLDGNLVVNLIDSRAASVWVYSGPDVEKWVSHFFMKIKEWSYSNEWRFFPTIRLIN